MSEAGGRRIVVVHHQPLEIFPPAMNLINYLSSRVAGNDKLYVITTSTGIGFKSFTNSAATIKRIYKAASGGGFTLLYNYGLFTLKTVFHLLRWRPTAIIYYESHSALPIYIYYKFFRAKSKLFIHYHEYMSPADYSQKGMRLVNHFHQRELYLYRIADWISHTNDKRMELFLQDNSFISKQVCRVVPNYPPRTWDLNLALPDKISTPVKLVYVGSFGSPQDLYIKEVLNWVKAKRDELTLDIYTFNISAEVREFISGLNATNIRVLDSVDYETLPSVLSGYDIGLMLYKGNTLNFKFNAPNKLFEYLALGKDVWFPREMEGCHPYIRTNVYPKIIDVDFQNLDEFDYREAISRVGLSVHKTAFFCDNTYSLLVDKLLEC